MMPKYRILVDHTPVISNLYMAGDEVDYAGWPRWTHGTVEPADADARAIFAYYQTQHANPWILPAPPDKRGRIRIPTTFRTAPE